MFKLQITLDRHNARQKLNYRLFPDPPLFSLPSTFKFFLKIWLTSLCHVASIPWNSVVLITMKILEWDIKWFLFCRVWYLEQRADSPWLGPESSTLRMCCSSCLTPTLFIHLFSPKHLNLNTVIIFILYHYMKNVPFGFYFYFVSAAFLAETPLKIFDELNSNKIFQSYTRRSHVIFSKKFLWGALLSQLRFGTIDCTYRNVVRHRCALRILDTSSAVFFPFFIK